MQSQSSAARCISDRESSVTVAQELARSLAGTIPVGESFDSVDDNRPVAGSALDAAPFARRKIVGNFADPFRLHPEILEVIDHDVGGRALAKSAAILEAGGVGRQRREPIVRLFE